MKKVAVYSLSRSFGYEHVLSSINSLVKNGEIDEIYILTEDDDVGFPLPSCCHVQNMKNQVFFPPEGANYDTKWTYMSLMQLALPLIFPKLDRILNIDCDTIVLKSLSALWKLPIDDYYYAAAKETWLSKFEERFYANTGVTMFNLKKLRDDGVTEKMIRSINEKPWRYINQDCINTYCQGKIFPLSNYYNSSYVTGTADGPAVYHFAGWPTSTWIVDPMVIAYRN